MTTKMTSGTTSGARTGDDVASGLSDVISALLGSPIPVRVEFWDGSSVGPVDGPGTLHVRSSEALRRIMWAPGELGLARAFVTGDLDAEGDVIELLTAIRHRSPRDQAMLRRAPAAVAAARRYGVLGRPLPPPEIEYQPPIGPAHTKSRDAETVGHHYDVSNDLLRDGAGSR
jgi:cyclopropane-fatty-acyl-phospholipid synthase